VIVVDRPGPALADDASAADATTATTTLQRLTSRPLDATDPNGRQSTPGLTHRQNVEVSRPRLVGINHVALEVGDLDEALAFYGRIFELELRGRIPRMAFVDLGDQFVAIAEGRRQPPDDERHFGLVVDDKEATRRALEEAGAKILPGRGLDFLDPWGNRIQVVQYDEIQFSKTDRILEGMGLDLGKTERALRELREKGLA
jgi:catechol 2,3-dioxygenase-like lactoylglutathione lyase family enzyme